MKKVNFFFNIVAHHFLSQNVTFSAILQHCAGFSRESPEVLDSYSRYFPDYLLQISLIFQALKQDILNFLSSEIYFCWLEFRLMFRIFILKIYVITKRGRHVRQRFYLFLGCLNYTQFFFSKNSVIICKRNYS